MLFFTAGIRARGDRLRVIVGVESFYELLLTSRSLSNCQVPSNTKLYVRVPSAITSLSLETRPSCVEVQFLIKCVGVSRSCSLTTLTLIMRSWHASQVHIRYNTWSTRYIHPQPYMEDSDTITQAWKSQDCTQTWQVSGWLSIIKGQAIQNLTEYYCNNTNGE